MQYRECYFCHKVKPSKDGRMVLTTVHHKLFPRTLGLKFQCDKCQRKSKVLMAIFLLLALVLIVLAVCVNFGLIPIPVNLGNEFFSK